MENMLKQSRRLLVSDGTFDPVIYRFVLFSLIVGLFATVIRLFIMLQFGSTDVLKFDDVRVGIGVLCCLALVLWRRPQFLRAAVYIIYLYLAIGFTAKLTVLMFWDEGALYSQLLWMLPWMIVDYVLSFLIFSTRTATILSTVVLCIWVGIGAAFIVSNFGNSQGKDALLVLSQTYLAQCILIVFLALYGKLQGLYVLSKRSGVKLEKLANTDFLLGTGNRRSILSELDRELTRTVEHGNPLCVILMDIDQFKQINDQFGHDIGDAVLLEFTTVVLDLVDSPRLFGRWGGDEFLLIASGVDGMHSYHMAQKIRTSLEQTSFRVGRATASFGVAEYRAGDDIDSLLKRADEALYESKRLGRNRVEVVV